MPDGTRTAAEIGSPEFSEDRTQINSLNNKRIHEEYQDLALTEARRSRQNYDNLLSRNLQSMDTLLDLQMKVNQKFFENVDDRARIRDQWNYNTAYDLANPATTAPADVIRSAAYTPNRSVDTASAGVAVSAQSVSAAVADAVNASLVPLMATLQQVVQALTTATTSIGNVVNQTQPKAA